MKIFIHFAALLLAGNIAAVAMAQSYPDRPLKLIVPFPPGGSNDVVARGIGVQLGEKLGQPVVIDNRGGAGGTIGTDAAAKAAPDGYTLLLISVAYPMNIALGRLPQESIRSFAPVAMLGSGPSVLAVQAGSPVSSVRELVALAKRRPGALNVGSAGIGSFQHLASELFKLQAGIDVLIVQYKGGGPAMTDLLAGQVDLVIGSLVQTLPQIRSGKLKALGIGGAKRHPALPDIPTIAEAGVPGYEATNWWGILAPAGTPATIVGRLHDETALILASGETQKRFELEGAEVVRMDPAEFGRYVSEETARWTRVVRQANIRVE
jgi:tripartite-type tricarboxylate transporter receptor subunit TctC